MADLSCTGKLADLEQKSMCAADPPRCSSEIRFGFFDEILCSGWQDEIVGNRGDFFGFTPGVLQDAQPTFEGAPLAFLVQRHFQRQPSGCGQCSDGARPVSPQSRAAAASG